MELCMWSMSWSRLVQLHPICCIDWSAIIDFNWLTPHYSITVLTLSCDYRVVFCVAAQLLMMSAPGAGYGAVAILSNRTKEYLCFTPSGRLVMRVSATRVHCFAGTDTFTWMELLTDVTSWDQTNDGRLKKLNNRWLMIKREIKRTETMVLRLLNLLHP